MLQLLKQELIELGLSQISYSPKDAYLLGKIPATTSKKVTAIGFVGIQPITTVKILKFKFIKIMMGQILDLIRVMSYLLNNSQG